MGLARPRFEMHFNYIILIFLGWEPACITVYSFFYFRLLPVHVTVLVVNVPPKTHQRGKDVLVEMKIGLAHYVPM